MSRYMQSEIDRLTGTVEALEAKLERAEGQVRAMREDAKRALNAAFDQRDAAIAAGQKLADAADAWDNTLSSYCDGPERDAMREASVAFRRSVSGSSEPR